MNEITDLGALIDAEAVKQGELFPWDGDPRFQVRIVPIPNAQLSAIADRHMTEIRDHNTGSMRMKVDQAAATLETAREAVIGWEGLTVAILRKIVPLPSGSLKLAEGMDEATTVAFNEKNLALLVNRGKGFVAFVESKINSGVAFAKRAEEQQKGNS